MTPWGLARIEVIAAKEHIESELLRGVPMKQIHDALVKSGRVSVTYNSFRRQIQPIRDKLTSVPESAGSGSVRRTQSSLVRTVKQIEGHSPSPKTEGNSSEGFQFNPTCKAEDFF